jgi:hypothetical protein
MLERWLLLNFLREVTEEIALANIHAVVAKDEIGGDHVEHHVRDHPAAQAVGDFSPVNEYMSDRYDKRAAQRLRVFICVASPSDNY